MFELRWEACKLVLLDQFGPVFSAKDCILHNCLWEFFVEFFVEILSEEVLKPLVFSLCWSLLAMHVLGIY